MFRLDDIAILSLDIFDTLLFRTVSSPKDIFEIVWNKYIQYYPKESFISCKEFKVIRIEAEKRAREYKKIKTGNSEVNLKEIYECVPNSIKLKKQLMEIELQSEKEFCYINYEILNLIKYAKSLNKKVVLTSDMYLSRSEILAILVYNKLDISLIDNVIVSNEYLKTKLHGDLFNVLIDKYPNIKPEKILHIGDSIAADYEMAIKSGIKAEMYDVIPQRGEEIFKYEKIRYNSPLCEIEALRKLALNMYNYDNEDLKSKLAYEIGAAIIGPVLTLFMHWCSDKFKVLNINKVFAFMREGELLTKLLKNELSDRGLSIEVKPLYVSRKSTFIPSIKEIDIDSLNELMQIKNLNVERFFNMLGFDYVPTQFKAYGRILIKDCFSVENNNINLRAEILEFVLDKKEQVDNFLKLKREMLIGYLRHEMKDFNNVATMDIGFKGTIQKAINKTLENNNVKYDINHFIVMGSEEVKDKIFDDINIFGYLSNFAENVDLVKKVMRTPDVVEQLIIASTGSTLGYDKINNIITPILGEYSEHNSEFKKLCWDGIFNFQKLWFEFRRDKGNIAEQVVNKKREIMKLIARLIDMPTPLEAKFIGDLQYDDNFGSDNINRICSNNDQDNVKDAGAEYVDKVTSYGYEYYNVIWPQGCITRIDEKFLLKKYLETNGYDEYFNAMRKVVEEVKRKNVKDVTVYGAGEVGKRLVKACQIYDLNILGIVDRKESLWGKSIEGIEIISLDKAVERKCNNFVIASFAFIDEIKEGILQKFEGSNIKPSIFMF